MSRKTPPFPKHNAWTTARFWSFVRSNLRQAWVKWPPRYECLNTARRPYRGTNKRRKYEYQCAICQEWFMQKEVEVDHTIPCGSLRSYEDLAGFVERLFAPVETLRCVCKECHKNV